MPSTAVELPVICHTKAPPTHPIVVCAGFTYPRVACFGAMVVNLAAESAAIRIRDRDARVMIASRTRRPRRELSAGVDDDGQWGKRMIEYRKSTQSARKRLWASRTYIE